MPFELIMLLGFFGSALLALLPETVDKTATDNFRRGQRQRRSDRGQGRYRPPSERATASSTWWGQDGSRRRLAVK